MGCCGAGRADASAADPDDVLRLHPGCRAVGDRDRRGRRDATGSRDGCVLRHARRDIVRAVVYAGVLCTRALDWHNAGRSPPDLTRTVERAIAPTKSIALDRTLPWQ